MAASEILTGEYAGHAVVVLDATGSGRVETAVSDVAVAGRSVIVDLAGLDYMDCAALGVLRRCHAGARTAALMCCSPLPAARLCGCAAADGDGHGRSGVVYATVAAAVAAARDASGQYRAGRPAVVPVRRREGSVIGYRAGLTAAAPPGARPGPPPDGAASGTSGSRAGPDG